MRLSMVALSIRENPVPQLTLKDISCDWKAYYDPTVVIIFAEFLAFHALIYALPVGRIIEGPKTYSGKKTEYRLNGGCGITQLLKFNVVVS